MSWYPRVTFIVASLGSYPCRSWIVLVDLVFFMLLSCPVHRNAPHVAVGLTSLLLYCLVLVVFVRFGLVLRPLRFRHVSMRGMALKFV
jgi:hypothetical protein